MAAVNIHTQPPSRRVVFALLGTPLSLANSRELLAKEESLCHANNNALLFNHYYNIMSCVGGWVAVGAWLCCGAAVGGGIVSYALPQLLPFRARAAGEVSF